MWMLALPALALAADKADEEVIVWGDPFLRWNQRWYVETEVRLPNPLVLLAWRTHELWVHALQARAVLDCEQDDRLGRNRIEARCTVEDIALVALPKYPNLERNLDVLVESADAMRGGVVQLQVSATGQVPNVDFEPTRLAMNQRTRERQEQLRQVLSRVILPFHIDLPRGVRPGARWPEYGSRLLSMPSEQGTAGSSELAHYLDEAEGHWILQSIGRAVGLPVGGNEALLVDEFGDTTVLTVPTDVFELEMHGVGIIDPATGILTERTWVVAGGMTASSPGVLTRQTYYHAGRFRLLGDDEHPSVGTTHLAYLPGSGVGPAWTPLEP